MIKANKINYIVLYSAFYLKKSHKVINRFIICSRKHDFHACIPGSSVVEWKYI